jgi:hypothetical protein
MSFAVLHAARLRVAASARKRLGTQAFGVRAFDVGQSLSMFPIASGMSSAAASHSLTTTT